MKVWPYFSPLIERAKQGEKWEHIVLQHKTMGYDDLGTTKLLTNWVPCPMTGKSCPFFIEFLEWVQLSSFLFSFSFFLFLFLFFFFFFDELKKKGR